MSEPYLSMAEIEAKYPNEWVLIDLVKYRSEHRDLLGGVSSGTPQCGTSSTAGCSTSRRWATARFGTPASPTPIPCSC